jgi:glycine cleavage system H protein
MRVPDDLWYSADHEWVRIDGTTARIGITDYAQDALGDVVFVQAPAIGTGVAAGEPFSEVESTKSVSDIYAPVAGTVALVNERLADEPALVNTDPYGDGWLCEITMSDTDVSHLLDAAAYRALTGS